MSFAEVIHRHISKRNVIEIGEVKLSQAYLYSRNYEIVITKLPKRKVLHLSIRNKNTNKIDFVSYGTISCLLHEGTGYVINN